MLHRFLSFFLFFFVCFLTYETETMYYIFIHETGLFWILNVLIFYMLEIFSDTRDYNNKLHKTKRRTMTFWSLSWALKLDRIFGKFKNTNPKRIGPLVPKKKMFEGFFFTKNGHVGNFGHVPKLMKTKFSFPSSTKLTDEIWIKLTMWFHRKTHFNYEISLSLRQGQRLILTFHTHVASFSHLVEYFHKFWHHWLQ